MPDTANHATASPSLSAIEDADVAAATALAKDRQSPAVRAAAAAGELGDQPPLLVLSGGVLAYGLLARDRRVAAVGGRMLASVLVATALKTAAKHAVSRTRPHVVLDTGHYEVTPDGPDAGPWHSFPSGHTAGSVAAARALARIYPAASWAAYAAAAGVALVQLPRGAHYPLDVVAGAAVGAAAEALVDAFWRDEAWAARQLTAAARRPPG